jgi:rhodanese-related sulfurtransferase
MLIGAGFKQVLNVSGGFISLSRYVRSVIPTHFKLDLPDPEPKRIGKLEKQEEKSTVVPSIEETAAASDEPLIVDVRSMMEFACGAVPGAANIPLDELEMRLDELGDKDRKIILYCASGSRSSYAVQILKSCGFTNPENGGSLMRMITQSKKK